MHKHFFLIWHLTILVCLQWDHQRGKGPATSLNAPLLFVVVFTFNCLRGLMCKCTVACVRRSWDSFQNSVIFFDHVGSGDQIWVVRLDGNFTHWAISPVLQMCSSLSPLLSPVIGKLEVTLKMLCEHLLASSLPILTLWSWWRKKKTVEVHDVNQGPWSMGKYPEVWSSVLR